MNLSNVLLIAIACASSGSTATSSTRIAADGETTLQGTVGGRQIAVTIWTHEVEIGKSDGFPPPLRHNSCTYTRTPCSVVEAIELVIDKKHVYVPRSAFCDWSDLNTAKLSRVNNRMMLIATGGDASEAYEVKIEFNSERVIRRLMASGMDVSEPTEITNYYETSSVD